MTQTVFYKGLGGGASSPSNWPKYDYDYDYEMGLSKRSDRYVQKFVYHQSRVGYVMAPNCSS